MSDEGAPVSVSERSAGFEGVPFGRTLKWLAAGALLYALLLLVAMAGSRNDTTWLIVGPSLYLTPVFGLPYVVASFDLPGRTRRLLYFLLCVPLAYAGAKYLTLNYATEHFDLFEPGRDLRLDLMAGGLGGLAGAAFAFALLAVVGLVPRRRSSTLILCLGALLLSATGAAGMAAGLYWTDALLEGARHSSRVIIWYEVLHFPWQLLFALLLAFAMRRKRARVEPAPPTPVPPPPAQVSTDAQAVAERMRGSISAE